MNAASTPDPGSQWQKRLAGQHKRDKDAKYAAILVIGGGALIFGSRGAGASVLTYAGFLMFSAGCILAYLIFHAAFAVATGRVMVDESGLGPGAEALTRHHKRRWLYVVCGVAFVHMVFSLLSPNFVPPRPRIRMAALTSMKQMGTAMVVYASEHDERLPVASRWMDCISPSLRQESILRVAELYGAEHANPAKGTGPFYGVAMMRSLGGINLSEVENTSSQVMIFESSLSQRNAASDMSTMKFRWPAGTPGSHVGAIVHCDASAKMIRAGLYSNNGQPIPSAKVGEVPAR